MGAEQLREATCLSHFRWLMFGSVPLLVGLLFVIVTILFI